MQGTFFQPCAQVHAGFVSREIQMSDSSCGIMKGTWTNNSPQQFGSILMRCEDLLAADRVPNSSAVGYSGCGPLPRNVGSIDKLSACSYVISSAEKKDNRAMKASS